MRNVVRPVTTGHPVFFTVSLKERGSTLLIDGLEVLRRLPREAPRFVDTAVFCPISRMGRAAADLMLTRSKESGGLDRAELSKVLFLHEGDLDAPEIGDRVRRHVGASGQR